MTPEELICDLSEFYGYEVDLSYAINYIDMVGEDYVNGCAGDKDKNKQKQNASGLSFSFFLRNRVFIWHI